MGLFSKIKSGLQKTRNALAQNINSVINSFTKIDEELFEELEEILIMSDIGTVTSAKICDILRERVKEEKVAVVPGTAFGDCGEGYARISYAYSVKHITTALERIEEFITELKSGKIK